METVTDQISRIVLREKGTHPRWWLALAISSLLVAVLLLPGLMATAATAQEAEARGPVTGFPLPRYVSIQASEAFARRGPSRSHRIDWVFQRRNMPMQVVAEHEHWRRVIDRD